MTIYIVILTLTHFLQIELEPLRLFIWNHFC